MAKDTNVSKPGEFRGGGGGDDTGHAQTGLAIGGDLTGSYK